MIEASDSFASTVPTALLGAVSLPCYPPRLATSRRLNRAELVASIAATLGQRREGEIWLFAYGSLIWRPEGAALERQCARVHGYHRGLNLWSRIHRGTPERPGLVLGLDRGGSCLGVAYRLPSAGLESQLMALWQREMPDDSYRPAWLGCRLHDGRRIEALGFVLERERANYAGQQPDAVIRQVFDHAHGQCGSSRDYLANTLTALRARMMPDRRLEATFARCAR